MRSATIRLPGHSDQACALVAEAIVDEYLRRDPTTRIRCTVTGGRGVMFVAGDIVSQADFDVSALVKRTIGSLGVLDDVEPFVSLEPVAAERVGAFRHASEGPRTVTGYATGETASRVPLPVELAKRIAKRLHDKRIHDPEWFWLGPDAEVTVIAEQVKPSRIILTVEHGAEDLAVVRRRVTEELRDIAGDVATLVNVLGPSERRGLLHASGSSLRHSDIYGTLIPTMLSSIGHDPQSVEKAGSWLARAAALHVLQSGANAALVQATYLPGEHRPSLFMIRDEKGRDRSREIDLASLSLDRVMKEWWRPSLNQDAAHWGFAGEPGLPWEE